MTAIEIARFTVRPHDIDTMLQLRPAMAAALREQVPGFIDLSLVRLDEHTWLDIVEWTDRTAALAAQDLVMQVPECRAVFGLIDQVISMEHGELAFFAGSTETVSA